MKTRIDDYLWLKIQKQACGILKFAWTVKPVWFTLWISKRVYCNHEAERKQLPAKPDLGMETSSADFPACPGCVSSPSSSSGEGKGKGKEKNTMQWRTRLADFLLSLQHPWLFCTNGQKNIYTHQWDQSALPAALSQLHCTDSKWFILFGAASVNLDMEKLAHLDQIAMPPFEI